MKGIMALVMLALIASLASASPIEDIQAAAKSLNTSERVPEDISLSGGMNVTTRGNATIASQKSFGVEFISISKMVNLTDDQ